MEEAGEEEDLVEADSVAVGDGPAEAEQADHGNDAEKIASSD